jgi:hypothetical protein
MGLIDSTATRWSFSRLIDGMGPIRIAVPSWRMPDQTDRPQVKAARVSQAELMDLFQGELRSSTRVAKRSDADFTMSENVQRQCLAQLRRALYAV